VLAKKIGGNRRKSKVGPGDVKNPGDWVIKKNRAKEREPNKADGEGGRKRRNLNMPPDSQVKKMYISCTGFV